MRAGYECARMVPQSHKQAPLMTNMGVPCPPLITAAFEFPADENTDG